MAFTIQTQPASTPTPADRDKHLRSEDFFFVDKHPDAHVRQLGRHARSGNEHYDVRGTLTIRGVAKEIALPGQLPRRCKDPWGNARIGFEAETTINRKEFGLMWNAALETGGFLVGDEVKISLNIQAIAQA